MVGVGACIIYKITIKKSISFWSDKKLFEQQYRSNVCYVGSYPNPVSFAQSITLPANQLGKGQQRLYAEAAVSAAIAFGVVTSWDKGRTNDITIRIS
jgi:hypothetical protein